MNSPGRHFIYLFLLIMAAACQEWEFPPVDGLELYLTFDDNVKDLSHNENNCIDSTSGKYVKGRWNHGLDFNGKTDFLTLSKDLESNEGLSLSFWVYSRGANGDENNGAIISKYNMTTHRRSFMVYSFGAYETRDDNRLSAAFYKYSSSSAFSDNVKSYLEEEDISVYPDPSLWAIINPLRIQLGMWTHCVINMKQDKLQAWINGILCAEKTREFTFYFDSPEEPVIIGNNRAGGAGSNNHFNGVLDELRIYSRPLTDHEILILYHNK